MKYHELLKKINDVLGIDSENRFESDTAMAIYETQSAKSVRQSLKIGDRVLVHHREPATVLSPPVLPSHKKNLEICIRYDYYSRDLPCKGKAWGQLGVEVKKMSNDERERYPIPENLKQELATELNAELAEQRIPRVECHFRLTKGENIGKMSTNSYKGVLKRAEYTVDGNEVIDVLFDDGLFQAGILVDWITFRKCLPPGPAQLPFTVDTLTQDEKGFIIAQINAITKKTQIGERYARVPKPEPEFLEKRSVTLEALRMILKKQRTERVLSELPTEYADYLRANPQELAFLSDIIILNRDISNDERLKKLMETHALWSSRKKLMNTTGRRLQELPPTADTIKIPSVPEPSSTSGILLLLGIAATVILIAGCYLTRRFQKSRRLFAPETEADDHDSDLPESLL